MNKKKIIPLILAAALMLSGCADFDDDDDNDVGIIYSTGEAAGDSGSQGGAVHYSNSFQQLGKSIKGSFTGMNSEKQCNITVKEETEFSCDISIEKGTFKWTLTFVETGEVAASGTASGGIPVVQTIPLNKTGKYTLTLEGSGAENGTYLFTW